jgi:predicted RNase H-like nuclease (RuvC/YqgF family)
MTNDEKIEKLTGQVQNLYFLLERYHQELTILEKELQALKSEPVSENPVVY